MRQERSQVILLSKLPAQGRCFHHDYGSPRLGWAPLKGEPEARSWVSETYWEGDSRTGGVGRVWQGRARGCITAAHDGRVPLRDLREQNTS